MVEKKNNFLCLNSISMKLQKKMFGHFSNYNIFLFLLVFDLILSLKKENLPES